MWRRIILKRQVKLGAGQSSAHWSALERRSRVRGGGVVYLENLKKVRPIVAVAHPFKRSCNHSEEPATNQRRWGGIHLNSREEAVPSQAP